MPARCTSRSAPWTFVTGASGSTIPAPDPLETRLELPVLVLDRADHLRRGVGLAEPLAEGRVPEEAGDAGERLEVAPSGVLGDDQEEEVVGGLPVDRVEVDALFAARE